MKKLTLPLSCPRLLILFILSILSIPVPGQGLINHTTLYIPESVNVYIDGDLINGNFLQNNGNIHVQGHWQNTQVYQGSGATHFTGEATQEIFNNHQAIHHVVMDGSGTKRINGTLTVTGTLALTQGIADVGEQDTLRMTPTAQIRGGSYTSHINGALTHEGSGYKYFPIGKNGKYRPAELLDVKGIDPVISLEVFEHAPDIRPAVPVLPDKSIYWKLTTLDGHFETTPVAMSFITNSVRNPDHLSILHGQSWNEIFQPAGDNTLAPLDAYLSKITSSSELNGRYYLLGETVHGKENDEVYLSTSLCPAAVNPENRSIRIFGDNLGDERFRFQVFNRWGELIFESLSQPTMAEQGWDGRHRETGQLVTSGAYPYLLKAVTHQGNAIQKKGMILVIQ